LFGARRNREAAAGASTPASGRSRRQVIVLTAAIAALAVIAGGLGWAFASGRMGSPAAAAAVSPPHARTAAQPAGPFRVLSVTPAHAAQQVNGAAPVDVVFSAPLAAGSPMPRITPAVRGTWTAAKNGALQFTPATGFRPHTAVTVSVPSGRSGVRSATGSLLGAPVTVRFRTGSYSTLRLQQLLAQLGYLPLTWTPSGTSPAASSANAQLSAAYQPPAGTFSWQHGYPAALTSKWAQGKQNLIEVGAIRAFEDQQGLSMDGVAGPTVWQHLLRAAATGQRNTHGYTYAIARKSNPETLTVWHNGHVVLHTLANTGISVAPTADGTYPVYLRYAFQIMQGTNPDGSHYADPVSNVAYFNGGDAVHYFSRATYGWPQSLGCVELPLPQSATAYHYLTYGSLVTVAA
jgi:peptidoglycan hydrolase-like protein with peptidoglycan-binding domain